MIIMGVDFHPEFQQMASVDTDTGEFQEKRLAHPEEAEKFDRDLAARGMKVRLRTVKVREISEAMRVSKPYAALVRAGRNRPHPRHWQALADLVGASPN